MSTPLGFLLKQRGRILGKPTKRLRGLCRLLSFLLFDVPIKRLDMLDKVYVDRRAQRIQVTALMDHLAESLGQEIINVGRYVGLDGIKACH